jgi:stringent starvation protein B
VTRSRESRIELDTDVVLIMSSEASKSERKKVLDRLLKEEFVLVHINTSVEGVMLPPHIAHLESVPLKISRLFKGGLELRNDSIVTDLRFDDSYFTCILPYESIWLVAGSKGPVLQWLESAPADAATITSHFQSATLPERPSIEESQETTKTLRPQLKRVK